MSPWEDPVTLQALKENYGRVLNWERYAASVRGTLPFRVKNEADFPMGVRLLHCSAKRWLHISVLDE